MMFIMIFIIKTCTRENIQEMVIFIYYHKYNECELK